MPGSFFAAHSAGVVQQQLCSGLVPKNSLSYPPDFAFAGIDNATYDRVLDRIDSIYQPILIKMGGTFESVRMWDDPTVGAKAARGPAVMQILMSGGLARHPLMTEDGFALAACHEVGHHFGGAPKLLPRPLRWSSYEGEADYFATLQCLKLYFDEASTIAWRKVNAARIPTEVTQSCAQIYSVAHEQRVCERSAITALDVSLVFQDVSHVTVTPQISTPDRSVVSTSNAAHPAPQCRLDTLYQGALCAKPVDSMLSASDYRVGTCTAADGLTLGLRPTCWFKP